MARRLVLSILLILTSVAKSIARSFSLATWMPAIGTCTSYSTASTAIINLVHL